MTIYGVVLRIFGYIFCMCYLGWLGCTEGTRRSIESIGRSPRYYPEKYVLPNERFRKRFRLEKKKIPKWAIVMFYTSYVYIGLFFLSIVLFIFLTHKENVILIAQYIWIAITGPVLVYGTFHHWLYSRSLKIDR